MNRRAFTLIEMIVVSAVLLLFLGGAYSLFFGGQKMSGRSGWLQYTVNNLRKSEQIFSKIIQSSSYPSTLTPSRLYDIGDTLQASGTTTSDFFVHLPLGAKRIKASSIPSSNVIFFSCTSQPERLEFSQDNRPLTIIWNRVIMQKKSESATVASLVWEERVATFTTASPGFASTLTAKPTDVAVTRSQVLVEDVEWIQFDVPSLGNKPSKITVTIHCTYPKDPKLSREGISAAIPNVGIQGT